MKQPSIFTGVIENEEVKPDVQRCFAGAWYHKVVSSKDYWLGIEGTITLPLVDIKRYAEDDNLNLLIDSNVKNLDNPSIYMGGYAENEADVGLTLSRVKLGNGNMSKGSLAFRPFWRYITHKDYDIGGFDFDNGRDYAACSITGDKVKNIWANHRDDLSEYYYLPGDKIRMIITVVEPEKTQLQIEVLEVSTIEYSVNLRKENNWNQPKNYISPSFSAPGHGTNIKAEYKRVNAIDQVSNEGKPSKDTQTFVDEAKWENTFLYRNIDGEIKCIPLNTSRSAKMNCPDKTRFTVVDLEDNLGGEIIQIHPGSSYPPKSLKEQNKL